MPRSKLHVEGELNKAGLNVILAKISERLDRLEGTSETTLRVQPLSIDLGAKGATLLAGGFTLNTYGDDLEKSALARGAHVDEAGQWVADQTTAIILEFNGTGNLTVYVNSGLTAGAPFTPTSDTVIT
jgi:hypothetical protein